MDEAQQQIVNKLTDIASHRHAQDNINESLQWKAFLDVFLYRILDDDNNLASKFNQAMLREGEEVYLENSHIVNALSTDYPEVAVFYAKQIKNCQDSNDLFETLSTLIDKSVYSDVFKKYGYVLTLHIHDEPVEWEEPDENGNVDCDRYIDGIGLQLAFKDNKLRNHGSGINEKTGKYQYLMYSMD